MSDLTDEIPLFDDAPARPFPPIEGWDSPLEPDGVELIAAIAGNPRLSRITGFDRVERDRPVELDARTWLRPPHRRLDGRTPAEAIRPPISASTVAALARQEASKQQKEPAR